MQAFTRTPSGECWRCDDLGRRGSTPATRTVVEAVEPEDMLEQREEVALLLYESTSC